MSASRNVGLLLFALAWFCGACFYGANLQSEETRTMRRVEIVAHRGASHDAPENTMPAVLLGWEQGADLVEIDVYLSKDQEVVLLHDKTTKRTTGVDRPVAEQTWAELSTQDAGAWKSPSYAGTKIPRLAEALASIPQGKRMLVEVKCGPEIVPYLKQEFAKSGQPPEAIVVICFQAAVCQAVREQIPEHQVYYLADIKKPKNGDKSPPTAEELVQTARRLGVHGVDLSATTDIDQKFVETIRQAGLEMHVWTVDDPELARAMCEAGVDSITTNRPAFLRAELAKPAAK
ncbi:glycerophosphodiester phosphodiesterase [Planctopirus ephydatiae]|nr:glycerophosphodiester phosphodiesterase [Planctopirus ephydatiae]